MWGYEDPYFIHNPSHVTVDQGRLRKEFQESLGFLWHHASRRSSAKFGARGVQVSDDLDERLQCEAHQL